jgi:hypothetical protein
MRVLSEDAILAISDAGKERNGRKALDVGVLGLEK